MCGLSASFLFAVVTRLVEREARLSSELAKSPNRSKIEVERFDPRSELVEEGNGSEFLSAGRAERPMLATQ
jgi:hypothetical protein